MWPTGRKPIKPASGLLFFGLALGLVAGCAFGGGGIKMSSKSSVSPQKLSRLEPGRTTFYEVLDLFGPPDYIIDGRQELPDLASWSPSQDYRQLAVRTLTSPEGQAILIYSNLNVDYNVLIGALGPSLRAQRMKYALRPHEVFIFVEKEKQIVVDIAAGHDDRT